MAPSEGEREDEQSDYEALVEFLYLAPVGIIKFRPDGTIDMANPTAAQLLMPLASDGDMSDLYRLLSGIAPDLRSHVERFQEPAGQIFDQMQLAVPKSQTTLMLDINKINGTTLMAALQNISDLTEARRLVLHATETQRLLASIFMRLDLPVVVTRADGFILMSNVAFQTLLGYDSAGLVGLNIDALLPPGSSETAKAARTQQRLDGGNFEVDMNVISRDGRQVRVVMNCSVLHESNAKQLRVVSLFPRDKPAAGVQISAGGEKRRASRVASVDFGDIRAALGSEWQAIASRAMALSDAAVRPLLGSSDIMKLGKDGNFIIWFADGNSARQADVLMQARIRVRRVLTTEFGSRIAERVLAPTA